MYHVFLKLTDAMTGKGFYLNVDHMIAMEWMELDQIEAEEKPSEPFTSISTMLGEVLVRETPDQIELMIKSKTKEMAKVCRV